MLMSDTMDGNAQIYAGRVSQNTVFGFESSAALYHM